MLLLWRWACSLPACRLRTKQCNNLELLSSSQTREKKQKKIFTKAISRSILVTAWTVEVEVIPEFRWVLNWGRQCVKMTGQINTRVKWWSLHLTGHRWTCQTANVFSVTYQKSIPSSIAHPVRKTDFRHSSVYILTLNDWRVQTMASLVSFVHFTGCSSFF